MAGKRDAMSTSVMLLDSFLQQGLKLIIALSGRAQRSAAAASGMRLQLSDVTEGHWKGGGFPLDFWNPGFQNPRTHFQKDFQISDGVFQTLTQTSKLSSPRLLRTAQPSKPGWSPAPGLPKRPGVCAWSAVLRPSTQHEKYAAPQHAVPPMPPSAASPRSISPMRPVRAYHRPARFSSPGACAL
jgi:hypothetical protein